MPEHEPSVPHDVSLAAWDLPSPLVVGEQVTLTVGVSCSTGCNLAGTRLELRDERGRELGSSVTDATPWPASRSLYWTTIAVVAPDTEGDHQWILTAPSPAAPHHPVSTIVRSVAVRRPEHRVKVEIVEKESTAALGGVAVRLGPFRTTTDDSGTAQLDVPAGTYQVTAWKLDYDLPSTAVHIDADASIRLEATPTPPQEEPYWM